MCVLQIELELRIRILLNSSSSGGYTHSTKFANNSDIIDLLRSIVEIHKCKRFRALYSKVMLRTYVDVKPIVMIVASMDLHVMGGGYYLRGLQLHIML